MSKKQNRGLGRGLGSLIPTAPPERAAEHEPPAGLAPSHESVSAGSTGAETEAGSNGSGPNGSGESNGVATSTPPTAAAGYAAVSNSEQGPALTRQNEGEAPSRSSDLIQVEGAYFAEIELQRITPNRVQPRQVFDEEAMAELVHSVREIGLLQPIVVRPLGDDFELIMGERRWRAAQEAGLEKIPAIVRETDDADMLRDALLENLHRSNLNPLEEAAAYQQLLEDFGCTHDELAQRVGRSRPQISNTLRLMKLSPEVQRRVAAGVLSAGHARALLAVPAAAVQDRLAQRVVAEGISVRALEEIVALGQAEGAEDAPPRRLSATPVAPGLTELSDRLGDRLETRVKIALGKTKGKVSVEFATMDDLRRIVDLIDPRNRDDRPI